MFKILNVHVVLHYLSREVQYLIVILNFQLSLESIKLNCFQVLCWKNIFVLLLIKEEEFCCLGLIILAFLCLFEALLSMMNILLVLFSKKFILHFNVCVLLVFLMLLVFLYNQANYLKIVQIINKKTSTLTESSLECVSVPNKKTNLFTLKCKTNFAIEFMKAIKCRHRAS